MKKLFFKGCLLSLALLIGTAFSYAAATDGIPKTINIQGKLTTDSGQPVTGDKKVTLHIYNGNTEVANNFANTTLDSDGLYNVDIGVTGISFNNKYSFVVDVSDTNGAHKISSPKKTFASIPTAYHASTATYSLSLDPNGDKLTDSNFDNHEYKIKVASANYAVKADLLTSTDSPNKVWGMKKENVQGWISPSQIMLIASTWTVGAAMFPQEGGLSLTSEGKVSVKLAANPGLNLDTNGLKVKLATNPGLNLDTNGLMVKLATNPGLNLDTNGLKIKLAANPGLNLDTNGLMVKLAANPGLNLDTNGLMVKLATDPGLNLDTNGLKIKLAANPGLNLDGNGLMVKLATNPGLNLDGNGLMVKLATDSGLNLDGNGLKVKLATNQGLDMDSNGLKVLVDGSTIFVGSDGKLTTNPNSGNADLAEIYKSTEDLQPGDVVSIDTTKDDSIVKTRTAEDTLVAGVISTEPGLLLNSAEKGYKLALVGKVPTKVCNEGGEIKRGDLLVSASIAGYAKKAGDNPKAGTVIGKALENFSSKRGTILVLVNLQ